MVTTPLNKIFLSASIPLPERDKRFYDTSDIIAIRDSIRALATIVIPNAHLIWGGHPAITPLIRHVMDQVNADLQSHVTLYQSNFFREYFPEDNFEFENVTIVEEKNDRKDSLISMREEMIVNNEFTVGIFIGGMEGVIDEYQLFKQAHPKALILSIASTGAAAKIIFEKYEHNSDIRLTNDYAYMALFRELLNSFI